MKFLVNKNILIISPEPWGKSMLSKHHYAVQLAKLGNRVWFLQINKAHASSESGVDGLSVLADKYSIRGIRYFPAPLRKLMMRRQIQKMIDDVGTNFDLIWSFDNSRFFDLDCFPNAFRIHHMMDYHVDYQNKIASRTADLCLGVTDGIVSKLLKYNPRSFFINHGYTPVDCGRKFLPPAKEKVKALYTGNLLMVYVNWPWLKALVKNNPDVHFYMAGSYDVGNLNPALNRKTRKEVDEISQSPNVSLLGECSPVEIQGYMLDADILYFAYRSNEFPEILANSHKIMAYLGSGKPVVCHHIKQYASPDPLLYMSSTLEEYLETFERIKRNLALYNSDELINKRKAWAMDNTYLRQIERIDQLITTP